MDLTDEQWKVLEPLVSDPPRREDGRGRPWRDPRDVLNGILWIYCAPERPGKTSPNATRPTRPATAASRDGSKKESFRVSSKLWPKTSKGAGR